MNNDSKWISIEDRKPPIGAVMAWVNGAYKIFHVWPDDCNFPGVTHWQHLPGPPPKPDPFETWWSANGMVDNHSNYRYVGYQEKSPLVSPVPQVTARVIWDAAIASTQNK